MIQRRGVTARYADSVSWAGTVYLVEVPANPGEDIAAQTRNVLASIERQLVESGSDKTRLLSATIYLRTLTDYDAMNAVWDAWVPAGCAPSRACIEARLVNPDWRIEIAVTAATGGRA